MSYIWYHILSLSDISISRNNHILLKYELFHDILQPRGRVYEVLAILYKLINVCLKLSG